MTTASEWAERFNKTSDDTHYEEFMVCEVDGIWVWEEYRVVQERQVGTSRWGVQYETVFEFPDSSFMLLRWEQGKTDRQEDHPKEYEACEVEPYTTTVTKYRKKGG